MRMAMGSDMSKSMRVVEWHHVRSLPSPLPVALGEASNAQGAADVSPHRRRADGHARVEGRSRGLLGVCGCALAQSLSQALGGGRVAL